MPLKQVCAVVPHCECVSPSHIEDLRYLCVVEEVLLLVVFLELCRVVVPALLRCVCAGMGVLLGLQSEGWGGTADGGEGGEDERMQEEGRMERCKTKCKVGEQMQGGGGRREGGRGDTRRRKAAKTRDRQGQFKDAD